MSKSMRLAIGIAVLALAGVACGAQRSTNLAASKAGGAGPPLALTIGTDDFQGKPASAQIEEFARRVKELSEGSITVDPVWHSAGDGPDWDQRVARMVVSGELDMGNIPARAWDTEGVTSLRALNAPFLITTDELVAGVITSELADELMSGLEEIGVVGLALLPEGLRHPFGFDRPLLGPEDYEGKTIRTPTSATTAAVFAALGATVTDDEPNAAEQAGMESAYILTPAGNATGNVTFYPKVNSLVINSQVLAELSDQQREILQQAATETRSWAVENLPSDAAAAAAFCELAHGIFPSILADAGLGAALEALGEAASLPVEVDAAGERCPAAVEMAAYLAAIESLEIAGRRAAEYVTVRTRYEGDSLTLDIYVESGGLVEEDFVRVGDRIGAVRGVLTIGDNQVSAVIPCV